MSINLPEFLVRSKPAHSYQAQPSQDEMLVQHTFMPNKIAWVNDGSMIPLRNSTGMTDYTFPLNPHNSLQVHLTPDLLQRTWSRSHHKNGRTSYYIPDPMQGKEGQHVFRDEASFQTFMRTPHAQQLYANVYGPRPIIGFPDPTKIPVHRHETN